MAAYYVVDPKGNIASLAGPAPDLSNLNANNLTSGTVPLVRLANIADAQIAAAAAIAWTKISKSGSSLADLATRSAADLSSGALAVARLGNGVSTDVTTTSTGTQNDFAPGIAGDTILRCNNASDLIINGFAGGVDGQRLTLVSIGAGNVFLAHQNTGSTAGNRLINFATSSTTPLAAGVGSCTYQYDATTSRWRLVSHDMGAPITPTFSAGAFTANGAMTWTVSAGNVQFFGYYLQGQILTVWCNVQTTTVGGTVNTQLIVTIPNSYTASKTTVVNAGCRITDNGTETVGLVFQSGSTSIICMRYPSLSNYTLSTSNTTVQFTIQIPVS